MTDILDNYDMSGISGDYLKHDWKEIFQGFFFRNRELIWQKDLILDKSVAHNLALKNYFLIKFTSFNFKYSSINSTEVWIEVWMDKIKKVIPLTENDFKRLQSTDSYVNYIEDYINELAARNHQKSNLDIENGEDYNFNEEEEFEWPEIEMNSELEDYDEDGNYIFVS